MVEPGALVTADTLRVLQNFERLFDCMSQDLHRLSQRVDWFDEQHANMQQLQSSVESLNSRLDSVDEVKATVASISDRLEVLVQWQSLLPDAHGPKHLGDSKYSSSSVFRNRHSLNGISPRSPSIGKTTKK